jgi:hypothetical protein
MVEQGAAMVEALRKGQRGGAWWQGRRRAIVELPCLDGVSWWRRGTTAWWHDTRRDDCYQTRRAGASSGREGV